MFTALISCVVSVHNAASSILCTARSATTGNCDSDGLHILRGDSLSSTPVATVCGDETLDAIGVSGPVLLNFFSNSHVTDFGFKISYQTTCE